jgi:hypothetical protein
MITAQDIKDAVAWLRSWAVVAIALGGLILLAGGIGGGVVTTGELAASMTGFLQ